MDVEILNLIAQAEEYIQRMKDDGKDTTNQEASLTEAMGSWEENHYVYLTAKQLLESLIDNMTD